MRILLITQEPPLTSDAVATGNAIRTSQLAGALSRAGHTLSQTWLDNLKDDNLKNRQRSRHPDAFQSRDELQAAITRQMEDVWELKVPLKVDAHSGSNWMDAK